MPKAKTASAETTATLSSGHKAARPSTRRKAHPKFELPEVHTAAATDWAFRDEPGEPVPLEALDIAAVLEPVVEPALAASTEPKVTIHWDAPVFFTGAAVGGVAIGLGIVVLTAYAAMQVISAPARLARTWF